MCTKGSEKTYTLAIHAVIDFLDRIDVVADQEPIFVGEDIVNEVDERFDAATLKGGEIGCVADHGELLKARLLGGVEWLLEVDTDGEVGKRTAYLKFSSQDIRELCRCRRFILSVDNKAMVCSFRNIPAQR